MGPTIPRDAPAAAMARRPGAGLRLPAPSAVLPDRVVERGVDPAGAHGIHPDAVLGELISEHSDQAYDPGLRSTVSARPLAPASETLTQ